MTEKPASRSQREQNWPAAGNPFGSQARLPRRFYQAAHVESAGTAWRVLLDGRPVRTPARNELLLPSEGLARMIAEEWEAQGEEIRPDSMPLTKLANTAIDRVSGRQEEVAAEILAFAESDLVCYRADWPEQLVERQHAAWDPLLAWLDEASGARLNVAVGVMHVAQPEAALSALRAEIVSLDAFALAAMHNMTTLMASFVLALAVVRGRLQADEAWQVAHVDEDWQISQWGEDAEARQRRDARWREMSAAAQFLELLDGLS